MAVVAGNWCGNWTTGSLDTSVIYQLELDFCHEFTMQRPPECASLAGAAAAAAVVFQA